MKIEVSLSNSVLSWILEQIPDPQAIPDKIMDNLHKWLSGEKQPTFAQVKEASSKIGIPLGFFFLNEPPKLDRSLLEFRTINSVETSKPSSNLTATIHNMEMVQDWIREDKLANDEDELAFVGSLNVNTNVYEFANAIRNELDITENWQDACIGKPFSFLRDKISSTGITVMVNGSVGSNTHRPLDINEFRAFALCNKYAPLIFINNKDTDNGKTFSLLHELVHIWLGENNIYNENANSFKSTKKVEIVCNAVAAEILVPNNKFVAVWSKMKTQRNVDDIINVMSSQFKCSRFVIIRRALDNGFISKFDYDTLTAESIEISNQKKGSGGSYGSNISYYNDKRFINRLLISVGEGRTQYTEAFRLTQTSYKTFNKYIQGVESK